MPPRARNPLARLPADIRGATAVEFALIAPILLSLLLGAVEAGRFIWIDAALDHAMREAARCASLDPEGCTTATMVARIDDHLTRLGIPVQAGQADLSLAKEPCGTRVSLALPYPPLVSGLWPSPPMLSADACIAQG